MDKWITTGHIELSPPSLPNTHVHTHILTGLTELLTSLGKYPGNSGTRCLHDDNLSDVRAQVAANQR